MVDTCDTTRVTYSLLSSAQQYLQPITKYRLALYKGPPTHPLERAYPCCIPTLGEFSAVMPREGSGVSIVITPIPLASRERSRQEDSHSGRVRTLGKRVKGNLSRVQIPHPPPFTVRSTRYVTTFSAKNFSHHCLPCRQVEFHQRPYRLFPLLDHRTLQLVERLDHRNC